MKITKTTLVLYSFALLTNSQSFAASYDVSTGKNCNDKTGAPFCTLSAAIEKAIAGDSLRLAKGHYLGPITIEKPLTLLGSEQGESIIDGQKQGSVITIAPATTVTLSRLRIQNGQAELGGGILNRGNLTVDRCRITGNVATQSGGGIYNGGTYSSQLVVTHSEITDNIAKGDDKYNVRYGGGGIFNDGPLTVSHTTIKKNRANENGGGIYTVFSGRHAPSKAETSAEQMGLNTLSGPAKSLQRIVDESAVRVDHTNISDNGADSGGGINAHGVLLVENSLISRNRAVNTNFSAGGGLFAHFDTRLRMVNSFIVRNQANYGGAGIRFYTTGYGKLMNVTIAANNNTTHGHAAGVFIVHNTAQLELTNSLIAENFGAGQPADCGGKLISQGYNLLGNSNGRDCQWQIGEGDIIGTPEKPILNQILWKKTDVIPSLTPTSVAIDGGNPLGCLGFDGTPLTVDYFDAPRPVSEKTKQAQCDIGALEWRAPKGAKLGKKMK